MEHGKLTTVFGLAALAVLVLVGAVVGLLPPDRLSIAAGREGSAYHAVAERYQRILARDGLTLEIVESAGSAENATLLANGRVDAAIVQGGVPVGDGPVKAEALAGLFPEALVLFHTGALSPGTTAADWAGIRLAAGAEGSGTRAELDRLAPVVGFAGSPDRLAPIGGEAAAEALLAGEVDAAVFVAPLDAPYLTALFDHPQARLAEPANPEALVRHFDHLVIRRLPRGAVHYAREVPDRDVTLLTMSARLLARPDLHPALVERLVNAVREVHSGRGLLQDEGEFPSTEALDAPLDSQARKLIAEGPSPLGDVMPYWMVAQIDRFLLLLLPVLFLLLPLIQAAPALYSWQMRARVYRHYMTLREIDLAAAQENDPGALAALTERLDGLEEAIRNTRLPPAYREHAYLMRQHVDLIRQTLARRAETAG